MKNRTFKAALLASTVAAGAAQAQTTLTVAAYGGTFEQAMREHIIPAFEAKHEGVRVEYVAGNSTDNVARLVAQRGNQQIDVAIVDDGPMYQTIALGFCAPLEDAPVYADLYDVAAFDSGDAVLIGAVATGLFYDAAAFEANGWDAPTSWNDIKDPKFARQLVIPPINNTYGLHTLVMMARLNGGGEDNIEPGFAEFIETINPLVLVYEPSPGQMTELFQSGRASIGVWGTGRVKALQNTGFPAEFVYPEEGAITLGIGVCPIADSPEGAEAQAFIQHLLTPEIQKLLAVHGGYGPVNRHVELTEEEADGIPYGPEQMEALLTVDWDVINPNREDWTRRWNREVER
jgi:putative spermidine/putrescine transport system substrate-binding protein